MVTAAKFENLQPVNFCFYITIITAVVTFGTFAAAVMTPPMSGPFCKGLCFEYPFTGIEERFPRDYYWMYPAMLVSLLYLVLMLCVHDYAAAYNKLFSRIGASFAVLSAAILIPDYFVQVSVIQPSLLSGETEGIALLSQYNSHGVFIVLEEISYLLMNLSFFAVVPVFAGSGGILKTIRILFISGFTLAVVSFVWVALQYGIFREYIFEVIIISIVWLQLIVASVLLGILFYRTRKTGYMKIQNKPDK